MFVFFQAEDGIRDLVRSRGLGDVYKRQGQQRLDLVEADVVGVDIVERQPIGREQTHQTDVACLLYTSDAADERSSVDLGGRRIIKKKTSNATYDSRVPCQNYRDRRPRLCY